MLNKYDRLTHAMADYRRPVDARPGAAAANLTCRPMESPLAARYTSRLRPSYNAVRRQPWRNQVVFFSFNKNPMQTMAANAA